MPGSFLTTRPPTGPAPAPVPRQGTLDELGTPLHGVTFCVVDLETTGGSAQTCGITEIGAVKVRGGEVLGEFGTLVNPGQPVPPFIAALTGITDAMVAVAPRPEQALPAFLEFARGCVLVAHNARFDVGFLTEHSSRAGLAWPGFAVVDTVRLARHVVSREEVRDHRLATLARLFRSPVTPTHRALDDARATVHVLHGLLARIGSLGVTTLEELTTFTSRVPESVRRKRHLAEALPHAPGVYVFADAQGRALYVGTSRDIRSRVRTYFTASESRSRMAEMVALAERVTPVVCATPLEAEVRELRLIAELSPPYNRRSRRPERAPWVKLTVEPFPRLSVVREVRDDGAGYLGPFPGGRAAERAVAALHEAFAIRQCTRRLPVTPPPGASACVLAEMERCGAPCTGRQSRAEYAEIVAAVREAMTSDAGPVVEAVLARVRTLAARQAYEDAATHRDRLAAFVRGASRMQRLRPLARCRELVAAQRTQDGGWEVVLVRHGRLAGTTLVPRGADPRPAIDALRLAAEEVQAAPEPAPAASAEETEKVLRWLEQPGVRLVDVDGEWTCPVRGAGARRALLDPVGASLADAVPFDGVAPRGRAG